MKKVIHSVLPYLLVCSTCLLILLFMMMYSSKLDLQLAVNSTHSDFQDVFFKNITNLGDGLFSIVVLIILSIRFNLKIILIGLISFLMSGMVSQILKKVFFPHLCRPAKILENKLYLVDGVNLSYLHSFPSGHTATAFALFIFLAFIYNRRPAIQIFLSMVCCLIGFSRIYLSQHFVIDVFFGAIIGILSFFMSYHLINKIKTTWTQKTWVELIFKPRKTQLMPNAAS